MGCADSSTLSSAPRSTGGYASLHTFTVTVAHTLASLHAIHSHAWTCICVCVTQHVPFFPSVSRSARLRLLYELVYARTHLSRVRHERPSLSLFSSVFVPLAARWSLARVRALAVTLCSFVSVSTSAESEVSDTDARSRIASFVYTRTLFVRWQFGGGSESRGHDRRGFTRETFVRRWTQDTWSPNVTLPSSHVSVSEESRGVSDGGRMRGNYSTFASNNGVNTVDTNRGKLQYRETFSSFEEYIEYLVVLMCFIRVLFANCILIDGLNVLDENECQPLFSN